MNKYDLAVLGAGPGGYVAAIRALQYGLKVAVIEEKDMGGTCLNCGCIPTKALLHSAEVFHMTKTAAHYGVTASNVSFNYSNIVAKKDTIVKKIESGCRISG